MSILLLRLAGPMQSWGTQSRFSHRDTGAEPSKSGVVGLLCAALGRPRDHDVSDLATLPMAVRVDREGRLGRDFHTALEVIKADGSTPDTVISTRDYLADASFLVGLKGPQALLAALHAALAAPHWPLFLGRKAFVPDPPVYIPDGLLPGDDLPAALQAHPVDATRRGPRSNEPLRFIFETSPDQGEPRQDVPVSFALRRFRVRHVRNEFHAPPQPAAARQENA